MDRAAAKVVQELDDLFAEPLGQIVLAFAETSGATWNDTESVS